MEQLRLFNEPPKSAANHLTAPSYECQLVARIPSVREASGPQMRDGSGFVKLCSGLQGLAQEAFLVVSLNQKNAVLDVHLIALGTLTGAPVHPREVFRPVILDAAAAVAFVHNHPSGNPEPSRDDREITARLVEVAKLLGIRVLDHVILGQSSHFSFVEEGLM